MINHLRGTARGTADRLEVAAKVLLDTTNIQTLKDIVTQMRDAVTTASAEEEVDMVKARLAVAEKNIEKLSQKIGEIDGAADMLNQINQNAGTSNSNATNSNTAGAEAGMGDVEKGNDASE